MIDAWSERTYVDVNSTMKNQVSEHHSLSNFSLGYHDHSLLMAAYLSTGMRDSQRKRPSTERELSSADETMNSSSPVLLDVHFHWNELARRERNSRDQASGIYSNSHRHPIKEQVGFYPYRPEHHR